ncbi:MAG: Bax inhibitor-1/YccA family protein [Candidatus Marinimicrobia bacterium]|nr:Bax inhibitor-1/YccA family protein [Candidatus Neomarinimicrobiota bacterium]|tara:strand:- start:225 stop:962 length:738 start_codon:yes stop_codon:yes gene_type:complete
MNGHTSFRSGNPSLNKNTFKSFSASSENQMTLDGTVNKTGISLLILMLTATYTWNSPSPGLMMIGGIGGFIVAMITIFKRHLSAITVPIYAALEGLMLGGVSMMFEQLYPGIVSQAIFLTFGILASLLLAYKSGLIKPTENFKLGVAAATGGIAIIYLMSWVMSFWGGSIPLIHSSSTFGILFSVGVIIIASLNLVLDFDFIEQGTEMGAPKYMEWYGAFGLMVTLIWLYLEILRLLAKLNSRRN